MTSALFFPVHSAKDTTSVDPEHVTAPSDTQLFDASELNSPPKAVILTPIMARPLDLGPLDAVQPLDALPASAKSVPADPAVPTPDHAAATSPAVVSAAVAAPSPGPGASKGVYMTVGAVLAKVNGTPIYTCQVLRRLEKEFSAKARTMNEKEFREFAGGEIARQLEEMIRDEVIFNQSLNALDEKDRELAQQIAVHIKQEKISAAGGSLELAKLRAQAEGEDFDDMMKREYRSIIHELVNHRIIEPLVNVSADDMRTFYTRNLSTLYSEKSRARFRVIQIDPAAEKGSDPEAVALKKITDIHNRAVGGEDFARLASNENTDDFLRSRAGDPGGWIGKGSYRLDDVEKAVWRLKPGQITPVIKTEGAYYIAKLEDKKIGVTRAFDDPIVQEDIYNRIWQDQIKQRWHQSEEASQIDSTITASEDRLDVAVDIVMQQYPLWASK
jgi:parvulin-like peptidyl-prolyl isomerase